MESRHLGGGETFAASAPESVAKPEGCALRLSADSKSIRCIYGNPANTWVGAVDGGSLSDPVKYGHSQKLLRLDEMPKDMTRLRLDPSNGPDDATFKATAGNKFLGATSRKK